MGSGAISDPPERKEGHNERSSGSEVPVDEEGERWDKIAAAYEKIVNDM